MNFNFGNLSNQSFTSSSSQHLKPYGIYQVKLSDIKLDEIKGTKDPNAVYKVVHLEFTGTGEGESTGTFQTNIFIPSVEADMERPTYTNAQGHEYQRPSRFENYQYTLMQIVTALNPEGAEKIKANASKIKTIDDFNALILKALANKNDVVTNLKLIGRVTNGVTYAQLPNACGLNRDGETFPVNFIGEGLFFTNYEITQQKNYQNAKPTEMSEVDKPSDSGFNLDDIEI